MELYKLSMKLYDGESIWRSQTEGRRHAENYKRWRDSLGRWLRETGCKSEKDEEDAYVEEYFIF